LVPVAVQTTVYRPAWLEGPVAVYTPDPAAVTAGLEVVPSGSVTANVTAVAFCATPAALYVVICRGTFPPKSNTQPDPDP
jgi:hypothetical protein